MSLEERNQSPVADPEVSEIIEDTLDVPKITIHGQNRLFSIALQFVVLFAFWLLLSGRYEAKYIIIGAISAALVTFLTNDLFYSVLQRGERLDIKAGQVLLQMWRFLLYIPWLVLQIIMANVQVAYLVLHPKMPIEPVLLLFRTRMRKGIAQVTLGNSITLTPGTITTSLEDGNYIIHTLKPPLASGLVEGKMQNRIAKVYLEEKEPKPEVRWVYSLEELEQ
ncbi:MAG: Na+/H+ antiporter subunit E [Chloroflexota bacterium]|nr:Na+/H+ antiporter subunit E [Chloroflexota bacterium]